MSTAKSKPTEQQWMEQKSFIRHEYLIEDISLKDLASLLATRGLHTTKAQLEYKLKKWHFSKYLDTEAWRSIERKVNRRKHQGKDSVVIHCRKRIEKSKVKKEISRHRETNIFAQLTFNPPSPVNSQLIVCTPPPYHTDTLVSDYFKIMIYKISNGMNAKNAEEWDMLIGPLITGLMNHQLDVKEVRSQNITTRAFFDTMFQNEIYWATVPTRTDLRHGFRFSQRPLHVIRWLLESGQDPDLFVHSGVIEGPVTPLYSAIETGHLELIQVLLRFNVRLKATRELLDDKTIVDFVLNTYNSDIVKLRTLKLLYRHCKQITLEEMLCIGIRLHDMELVLEILHQTVDATKCHTRWTHSYDLRADHETPLSIAVETRSDFANVVLDYLSNNNQLAEAVTADVFVAAAIGGSYETFCRLLKIQPCADVLNAKGISPLEAAVSYGSLTVCELLLKLHGGASPELVLLAAINRHEEVLSLLIHHGADINAKISEDGIDALPCLRNFSSLIKGAKKSILELLVHVSTKPDDESSSKCLEILIEAGARLAGGEVAKFAGDWVVGPLKAALSAGGSPDEQNGDGHTALQSALYASAYRRRHSQYAEELFVVVETLLQARAKFVGGEVVTAIGLKDPDLVGLLLRYGGTLRDIDSWGASCLEAEIFARNSDFLQDVLEASDDNIDAGPICAAIQVKDWALVDRLCTRRHKETECHLLEGTAIGLAAGSGNLRILKNLFARFTHSSTLRSAILPHRGGVEGVLRIPRTLNSDGGDWDKGDFWRQRYPVYGPRLRVEGSPLALAVWQESISGFRELLKKGCRADTITLVSLAGVENSTQYLEALSQHQPLIDDFVSCPYRMRTPLFHAVRVGDTGLAKWLVEAGSDINEYDPTLAHNCSPLQLAVEMGDLDMVGYLVGKGALVNAPPAFEGGATALQCAAIEGHLGLASQLLQRGARVNARGARWDGTSALEGAAENGRLDMIELLLHHGAAITGFGRKQLVAAVQLAKTNAFYAVAEWLQDRCGWAKEDEELLKEKGTLNWHEGCKNCRHCCCDEIHGSEDECIHDYSPDDEQAYADICRKCIEEKKARERSWKKF